MGWDRDLPLKDQGTLSRVPPWVATAKISLPRSKRNPPKGHTFNNAYVTGGDGQEGPELLADPQSRISSLEALHSDV